MFAKLVGEGFDKPDGEQELPIDINYAKLVEWVVRCYNSILTPYEDLFW